MQQTLGFVFWMRKDVLNLDQAMFRGDTCLAVYVSLARDKLGWARIMWLHLYQIKLFIFLE